MLMVLPSASYLPLPHIQVEKIQCPHFPTIAERVSQLVSALGLLEEGIRGGDAQYADRELWRREVECEALENVLTAKGTEI